MIMRKNSPRKWLHAILDLLPVILIPVFMIYSHRHTIDSYSVTRQEKVNQPYNFYQCVYNGKPNSIDNWEEDIGHLNYNSTYHYLELNGEGNSAFYQGDDYNTPFSNGDYLYFSCKIINYNQEKISISNEYNASIYFVEEYELADDINVISVLKQVDVDDNLSLYFDIYDVLIDLEISNIQVFNLTEIFGSGNEPTKEQFENMLTQDYYEFGNNYVDNYVTTSVTYDDTDIMSQFTYNLYNSVDKYFNMNNVFGMNNVYSWFETNIFHGTAPLYIYIVWNIVLYEFVMDLLMLLYSLFMWFIDICQNLIDRCYTSSKGGN